MILQTVQHRRNNKRSVPIYLGACVLLTVLLTGLVGLRLYSLSLEYRLAYLQQQLVSKEDTHDSLEKELARLVSPSRVFAKATNDLGMKSAPRVAVVRIESRNEPVLAKGGNDANGEGASENEASMVGRIMNLLTRKASARQ
jgi:cell division protein FtsL